MSIRALLPFALCATLALTSCGLRSGPEQAAQAWMNALADGDGMRLAELTCDSAQGELQTSMTLYSAVGVLSSMFLEGARPQVDVNELDYQLEREDGETAEVRITGRLRAGLLMMSGAQQLNVVFPMRFERGAWRLCSVNPRGRS
ncbi:MAG TPA: hypothetical protein VGL99_19620 [Chloroflexota bacterium]|jgi:hypothetical protein